MGLDCEVIYEYPVIMGKEKETTVSSRDVLRLYGLYYGVI